MLNMTIQSFKNSETRDLFVLGKLKRNSKWRKISKIVLRKLDMLHYAYHLDDLRSPPGNRLEALKGDMFG